MRHVVVQNILVSPCEVCGVTGFGPAPDGLTTKVTRSSPPSGSRGASAAPADQSIAKATYVLDFRSGKGHPQRQEPQSGVWRDSGSGPTQAPVGATEGQLEIDPLWRLPQVDLG